MRGTIPAVNLLARLFGPRHVTPPEVLSRLEAVESRLRLYQTEQVQMHDDVRRWMRRAVAAERRLIDRQSGDHQVADATPTPAPGLRGSIRRIRDAQRLTRLQRSDPLDDPERVEVPDAEVVNGVHP